MNDDSPSSRRGADAEGLEREREGSDEGPERLGPTDRAPDERGPGRGAADRPGSTGTDSPRRVAP
jgi:hypothetical protein